LLREEQSPEAEPIPATPLTPFLQSKAVLIGESRLPEAAPVPAAPLDPPLQSKAVLIGESQEVIPSVLPVVKPLRESGFTVSIYDNEERFTTFSTPLGYERILNCVRRTSVGLGLKEADPECFNGNVTNRGALLTGCWLVVEVRRHNTDNRCKIHFDYKMGLEAGWALMAAAFAASQASVQVIIRDAIRMLEQSIASGG
jgi:hypothetical protein